MINNDIKLLFLKGLFIISLLPASTLADQVGMVTGSETGTYIKFGKDIARISKQEGVDILVKTSDGSVDNIKRMNSKENAAFAIVQSDVLGYLSKNTDRELRRTTNKLRLVYPFYNEEVHLFANKNIKSIYDLDGKKVVVGKKKSGTNMTAWNVFKLTGVNPSKRIYKNREEGIEMVLTGKADAMFTVVAKPVDAFKNLFSTTKPGIKSLLGKTHFVPLNSKDLLAEYVPAKFNSTDYEGIESVDTIAVKAMLVSFDFSKGSSIYYKERCKQLEGIGKAIRNNITELKTSGHKKWKEVNLSEQIGLWKLDKCSRKEASRDDVEITPVNPDVKCVLLGTCN